MKKFKERWQIQHNWELIFPLIGILALVYSSYKLVSILLDTDTLLVTIPVTAILYLILLRFFLFLFKKLENRYAVKYRWEMIRIFIVFAITGSTSAYIGKPIIAFLGITKENLNPFFYWVLYVIIGLFFYQILLVSFGWLFGQFKFFWEFEKKMLRRLGLKRLLD